MADDQRIKGQEVEIIVVRGGELEDTLTDIQNFNFTPMLEVKSTGYLGRKTQKKDMFYKGAKFDCELHVHNAVWLNFIKSIIQKAKRETPDVEFNITLVANMPNGQTPTILFPDCAFGDAPHSIGGQGEYVKFKIQGECEDTLFSVPAA